MSGWFHWYGAILGLALLLGFILVRKISLREKLSVSFLDDTLFPVMIAAVIGARLYHLITDAALYTHTSLLDLIAVWHGGLGFFGAILGGGGMFMLLVYRHWEKQSKKGISFLSLLFSYGDCFAFGIPLAQAIGRLGNFVNGELYGPPTTLPWGIWVNGQKYHPLFLYESLLNLLLCGFLLVLYRKKALVIGKGQYVALYLAGYGMIRFFLEFLRNETARWDNVFGVFSIAQWVAFGLLLVGTSLFWIRRHAPRKEWDVSLE